MPVLPQPEPEIVPVAFESLDERFAGVRGDKVLVKVATGCRWTEGPAAFPAGRYVVFSDIPNDRMLRIDETDGSVSVFRSPSGFTNGNSTDRQGRLLSCVQGGHKVTRTEHDGSVTVLADSYEGKPLNSPNDIVEKSDGSIWFTDPAYGIDDDYEGYAAEQEYGGCYVFRIDPNGQLSAVITDMERPNGLAFGPGERELFVSDTADGKAHIRRFTVGNGELTGGEVFADCYAGVFDGFRFDTDGRLWSSSHEGLHVFADDGTMIGKLPIPEIVSNLVFGGRKRNVLYITASTGCYSYRVGVNGMPFAESF